MTNPENSNNPDPQNRQQPLTFGQYLAEVDKAYKNPEYAGWRLGQTYFNILHRLRPDLADEIRGTSLDPYHFDSRIGLFRIWLEHRLTHTTTD